MDFETVLRIGGEVLAVGGGCYVAVTAAIRVELRYLRRDVDRAQAVADDAHRRLNQAIVQGLPHGRI